MGRNLYYNLSVEVLELQCYTERLELEIYIRLKKKAR